MSKLTNQKSWNNTDLTQVSTPETRPTEGKTASPRKWPAKHLHLWTTLQLITMAQTPRQRLANERFARAEAAKRGKPESVTKRAPKPKAPISTGWIGMHDWEGAATLTNPLLMRLGILLVLLAFAICGGLIFELLRVVPELWSSIASFFSR
ncbi:hypothetical protein VTN49DRAFT_2128 [Thermomyces lanuginosus]|uniref:uncharacterized protein n=1 Tax=Thermomyces lanuginosus TaxID=5541 RepID=UPI0037437E09